MEKLNSKKTVTLDEYKEKLKQFQTTLYNAIAISQYCANKYAKAYKGYSTYIFTQLCGTSTDIMFASPLSPWSKKAFDSWNVSSIAGYVRSILEGEILFSYLSLKPENKEHWEAKLKVMHLNDCTRRIKMFETLNDIENLEFFEKEKQRLKSELNNNSYFNKLPNGTQKICLSGKALMITSRDEMLEKMKLDKDDFTLIFNLLSNYVHILPIAYYRIETNGRGTGCLNDVDLGYFFLFLETAEASLFRATRRMKKLFLMSSFKCRGLKSKFNMQNNYEKNNEIQYP